MSSGVSVAGERCAQADEHQYEEARLPDKVRGRTLLRARSITHGCDH